MKMTNQRTLKQGRLSAVNMRRGGAMFLGLAALMLVACDKKDPIYNTSHPDHGMVTLTTDWSAIGEGLSAPDAYTVSAVREGSATTAYTAILTGVTNKLDHLFEPGEYNFNVYNTPEQVTVEGTEASVLTPAVTPSDIDLLEAGPADTPEHIVYPMPGWLFTGTVGAAIAADSEKELTVPMHQQMRQLTLIIEPTGASADRVESITGSLSGVAGTLDIENGTHGTPSHVALNFSKITTGTNAGKWSVTVRLLGIAGTDQQLTGLINFAGGDPASVTFESNLSKDLASFNTDKRIPLILEATLVETTSEDGFTYTINNWTAGITE